MSELWSLSDTPEYECDRTNEKLKFAYWEGHRDFAYDLLQFVKPDVLVELGSQYGCSLFTFCQSVKNHTLHTQLNAVDYWKGDIGAEDTGEEVYQLVQKIIHKYYADLNIRLFQMGFDEAVSSFEDESIDILHIDGGHRYEDVEHDLSTWIPKLKNTGIILFHDVYSPIDQGSCVHWQEIKRKYVNYFEFRHSCGLGILFPKEDYWYHKMIAGGFAEKYKDVYYYRAKYIYTQNRFDELSQLYEARYEAIEEQSRMIDERDEEIRNQKRLIENQKKIMDKMNQALNKHKILSKIIRRDM